MSDPSLPENALAAGSVLPRIKIVMVETSLAANLGAAARAMKTMGLMQLVAVSPREPLDSDSAVARASGAQDVLQRAVCCDSLDDALQGCSLVIGTSARSRNLPWPMVSPVELPLLAQRVPAPGQTAILFGRERSGLTNEELARCHYHLHIPSNPDYSSLNIAAAVQVVAYELRRQTDVADIDSEPQQASPMAAAEDLEGYFDHLQRVLVDIGFADPNNLRQLMLKLRRFYMRAQPEPVELNILRGIISQTEKSLIRARSGQDRAPDRSQDSH